MDIWTHTNESETEELTNFEIFQGMLRFFHDIGGCRGFRKDFSWVYHEGRLIMGIREPKLKGTIAQPDNQKVCIEMTGLGEKEYAAFNAARLSFLYDDNPLLGERMFSDGAMAVFRRSDMEIPEDFFPESERDGLVFCDGEVIGTLPIPYVVCWGHQTMDGVEAADMRQNPIACVCDVARRVDGTTADALLMALEDMWDLDPEDPAELGWHTVVAALLRQLAGYRHLKEHFRMRRPHLLFADRLEKNSRDYKDKLARRYVALQWLKKTREWRLVSRSFMCLGIPKLENVCAANDGFRGTPYENEDIWY